MADPDGATEPTREPNADQRSDAAHAERRTPAEPEGAFDLDAAIDELLAQAHSQSSGRAARTLTPGPGAALKQTLLALRADHRLDEHTAPGPASIQVLRGSVTLSTAETSVEVPLHHWATIPPVLHDLCADTDAVVLLTVAPVQT
jgi:quercetin dioxygenase-like cupin family protein